MLEQWGVDPNPKPAFERCEDTLEMFPAVPADEVEKPPVRPPQRPPAKEKEKTLVLLRYTMGKQMLAYFFALRYITKLYKCQKRQFCLGSITKCDVIRTGGGFQRWGKKRPKAQYVICLANYRYCALGRCMVFLFFGLGGVCKLPQAVCKGWKECLTPALQVVIVPHLLGEHKRVRSRMNSSKRFTVRYIGLLPC